MSFGVFDSMPACGEISCDECNERFEKAVNRIASLEAERERLRECIINFIDNCLRDEKECPYCREATALVGGEVKNG